MIHTRSPQTRASTHIHHFQRLISVSNILVRVILVFKSRKKEKGPCQWSWPELAGPWIPYLANKYSIRNVTTIVVSFWFYLFYHIKSVFVFGMCENLNQMIMEISLLDRARIRSAGVLGVAARSMPRGHGIRSQIQRPHVCTQSDLTTSHSRQIHSAILPHLFGKLRPSLLSKQWDRLL